MILLYVLSGCDILDLSAESCTDNVDCWQSFGLGFYCSNQNEDTENVEESDFFYCVNDSFHQNGCELLTKDESYFFYSDETSKVSNIGEYEKLDSLITIIADASEHPDWITAFEYLYTEQQSEQFKNEFVLENLTPINVLLCDSDIKSTDLVDNFGTQFLLLTRKALQKRDMSDELRSLENKTTHLFVVDSDKFGLNSSIEPEEPTSEVLNLTALSEIDPDRVWYGMPSIEQELDILNRSLDDGYFVHEGFSIFPADIPESSRTSSEDFSEATLSSGNYEFILTPYNETKFSNLVTEDIDIYLYNLDNSIIERMNSKMNEIQDDGTTIHSNIYIYRNSCPIQDDLTYQSLYLSYVVNSFLDLEESSYLKGEPKSHMAARTKYFLENITSSTTDQLWNYEWGLTISPNWISKEHIHILFDDTTYALMGETEAIQFLQTSKNTRERKKCLEIQPFMLVNE